MTHPTPAPAVDADVAALREAISKGPTRGEWSVSGAFGEWSIASDHSIGGPCKSGRQFVAACFRASKKDTPEYAAMFEATARYLAACSPDRLERILTALTAAQARVEAVEWISVDERLPEFGEHVLCCYPTLGAKGGQPIQAVLFLDEEFGKWFFGCDDDMEGSFMPYEPTHWRPLPPPPATDSAIGGKGA